MSALGYALNALDYPTSIGRDVVAGLSTGNWDMYNPFDQRPFSEENRIRDGRELLRIMGVAGPENNMGNFAAGYATDVLVDPLTWMGGLGLATSALKKFAPAVKFAQTSGEISPHALKGLLKSQHTIDDLRKMATGEGTVKLYHGSPFAKQIAREGFSPTESGESAAMKVAEAYGIPWSEWRHRVEPDSMIGAGYGSEPSRVSTAPANIAARWAAHFPQGEAVSELNAKARMYAEAKRRGVDLDDLYEQVSGANTYEWPDSIGAPQAFPEPKYGNVVEFDVDARAIPRNAANSARMLLKRVERGDISIEDAERMWNDTYLDAKIHPSNMKNPRLVRSWKPLLSRVAEMLGPPHLSGKMRRGSLLPESGGLNVPPLKTAPANIEGELIPKQKSFLLRTRES